MIITNNFNLPDAIYNVICKDNYVKGSNHYSVTELIESPRIVQLKRRYYDLLQEDAIDRIWAVFGSAVHHLMETHASDSEFVEERRYIERLGRVVGGMVDCYNDGCISDYKVTSAWSIIYGSHGTKWAQQLNLYAHILREGGIPVERLQINAFIRDWQRSKAKTDPTYPQVPLLILPIELWSPTDAEDYLCERLILHKENETSEDSDLNLCLPEDMWESPTKFAVMKPEAKRATRVLDTEEEAQCYISQNKGQFHIVERPGKRTRCEEYCSMNCFCTQYQEYLRDGGCE